MAEVSQKAKWSMTKQMLSDLDVLENRYDKKQNWLNRLEGWRIFRLPLMSLLKNKMENSLAKNKVNIKTTTQRIIEMQKNGEIFVILSEPLG